MNGTMQGHHGLSSASRTRHARGPAEISGNELTLLRVEKDSPLVPGRLQRALEFFDTRDDSETTLSVGMGERVWCNASGPGLRSCHSWCPARSQFEDGLCGFRGEIA